MPLTLKYRALCALPLLAVCTSAPLPYFVQRRTVSKIEGRQFVYTLQGVHWRGSPRELAQAKAVYFKKNPVLQENFENTGSFAGIRRGNPSSARQELQRNFPEILQEIEALGDELGLGRDLMLSIAGSRFAIGGCSVYGRARTEPVLVGNYDWAPGLTDGLISSYDRTSGRFGSVGISEMLVGRLSGVNDQGLAVTMTAINSSYDFGPPQGLAMPIIVRGVLDKARNVSEAVRLLQGLAHSSPYNYALADAAGNIAVVEATPLEVRVRQSDAAVVANHFKQLSNEKYSVRVFTNSMERTRRISQFVRAQNSSETPDALLNFFADKEKGPAMRNYSGLFGTLWTVLYLPRTGRMLIRISADEKTSEFKSDQPASGEVIGRLIDIPEKLSEVPAVAADRER